MNYDNTNLCDKLAREYVLGTMTARVRRRFQRLLVTHPHLQQHVHTWEARFQPLADKVMPTMPSPRVWQNIEAQIAKKASVQDKQPKQSSWLSMLRVWQGLAAFASVFAAVAIFMLVQKQPAPMLAVAPSYVAVMENQAGSQFGASSIVAQASKEPRELSVEWRHMPTAPTGGELHLWAVAEQTGQIQSLGTLQVAAKQRRALNKAEWAMIKNAHSLFITLENAPPAGKPAGPVLYKGLCVQLA